MKKYTVLLFLILMFLIGACSQKAVCPPGSYYDAEKSSCRSSTPCPDPSMNDLNQAVSMAIACVKQDSRQFDKAFAELISIARRNPNIENSEIIYRFIDEVAVKAPYVPQRGAKAKWNRYFSPVIFVTVAYSYDTIAAGICPRRFEIKDEIDRELSDKKTGLLDCMANHANKSEAQYYYREAETNAASLKKMIDATCRACCSK